MRRIPVLLFAILMLIPGVSQAIQLHWSTGADTLRFLTPVRAKLVVKADVSEGTLPQEWVLFWRGDSTEVVVQPVDSLTACSGDTANVKRVDPAQIPADTSAHEVTVQVCRGSSSSPTVAGYVVDLPAGARGKFVVAAFNSSNPTAVAQSNEVLSNSSVFEEYKRVVTVGGPATQAFVGSPLILNAAVSPLPTSGATVSFYDGAIALGSTTTVAGVAMFSTSSLGVGAHSITAKVDTIVSPPFAVTVLPLGSSSVALTAAPSPSRDGQQVSLSAVVTPSTATGSIVFTDGGVTVGGGALVNGRVGIVLSGLSVGSHSFVASYGGDAQTSAAASTPLNHTVQPLVSTTTSLAVVPSPGSVGQGFQLRATVSPAGSTGSVMFSDGFVYLGSAPLIGGIAVFSMEPVCGGNHTAGASYSGDSTHYVSSTSVQWTTTAAASSLALRSSLGTAPYTEPVHFIATITDSSHSNCGRYGSVQFSIDGVPFGAAVSLSSDSVVSADVSTLLPGNHTVQAVYSGSLDLKPATSPVITQVIVGPEPHIVSVRDVAGDQGGKVKVNWDASALDLPPYQRIESYYVLRSVPAVHAPLASAQLSFDEFAATANGLAVGTIVNVADPDSTYYWEYIGTQPASHIARYSYVAPTTTDSLPGVNRYTAFMVMARSNGGAQTWFSRPDSGYSVDNLPPLKPLAPLTFVSSGGMVISWLPAGDTDLSEYRVYRGTDTTFVPGPLNLIARTGDVRYVDPTAQLNNRYKIAAVDIHGNVGDFALAAPIAGSGVDPGHPLRFALEGVRPNPFRGTSLAAVIELAEPSPATLELLDIAGRRVASRDLGDLGVGRHDVTLPLGSTVAPGLYLVRLTQGRNVRVARVAVLR